MKSRVVLFLSGCLCLLAFAELPECTVIPSGSFIMGSDSLGFTMHNVSLSHTFELSTNEITASQYASMLNFAMAENAISLSAESISNTSGTPHELVDFDAIQCPVIFDGDAFIAKTGMNDFPMVEITWFGAAFYCNYAGQQHGFEPLYNLSTWQRSPVAAAGLRLPTEAEWEYAARYNDGRTFPWGEAAVDSTRANCFGIGPGGTTPVGTFSPAGNSQLGLHDMAGNVWEWCEDWFGPYPAEAQVDPTGPITGERKVIRGGGWMSPSYQLLCAHRSRNWQDHSYYDFGFRIVQQSDGNSIQQPPHPQLRCRIWPNPFNPITTIAFSLTEDCAVTVCIYNIRGQLIRELLGEDLAAGSHAIHWRGTDSYDTVVSSGIYFCDLKAGNQHSLKKLILLK